MSRRSSRRLVSVDSRAGGYISQPKRSLPRTFLTLDRERALASPYRARARVIGRPYETTRRMERSPVVRFPASRSFPNVFSELRQPLKGDRNENICKRRRSRRSVLFALRVAGHGRRNSPGRGGSYARGHSSLFTCGG